MAQEFYTNYQQFGNDILLRYVDAFGTRKIERVKSFAPKLFVPARPGMPAEAKDIFGRDLVQIPVSDIKDARQTIEQYSGVDNMSVYGYDKFAVQFIASRYKTELLSSAWSMDKISVLYLDIETECERGFPDPNKADEKINIISFYDTYSKRWYVFGLGQFQARTRKYTLDKKGRKQYLRDDKGDFIWERLENAIEFCYDDEAQMLKDFVDIWERLKPDVVTGWNVEKFDITYVCNRIMKLLGEQSLKRLSPWGRVNSREIQTRFGLETVFDIVGVSILDMRDLYKKFVLKPRDNYKLDTIAEVDLKDEKLRHKSGKPGHLLYTIDFQAAVDYNIHDVQLVVDIEELRNLVQIVFTIAYTSLTNYSDVLSQIRTWDCILYNYCRERGVEFLANAPSKPKISFEGGYVKPPIVGKKKWVVSFDVTSEYPSLLMALNISPEKLVEGYLGLEGVDRHLELDQMHVFEHIVKNNWSQAANGVCFSREGQGFMAAITVQLFDERAMYKKKMLEAKKAAEKETDPAKKKELKEQAQRYDLLQNARKVQLNSLYGAMGNEFFRFFDIRMADAITSSGRLLIQWVARDMNAYINKLLGTKPAPQPKDDHHTHPGGGRGIVQENDYIIAIDTDSIYVDFGPFVEKALPGADRDTIVEALSQFCATKCQDVINASFKRLADHFNAFDPKRLSMKREAISDAGVFLGKKRYILNVLDNEGVRYEKADLKVMGLEAIKSSTPGKCREWMQEVFPIFLFEDEKSLQAKIASIKDEYLNLPPNEIAANTGVSEIDKYDAGNGMVRKSTPINSRAAIVYNNAIRVSGLDKVYPAIKADDKVKYVMLKTPNKLASNVIAWPGDWPHELGLDKIIDREEQFFKTFAKPMEAIAKELGWDLTEKPRLDWMFD